MWHVSISSRTARALLIAIRREVPDLSPSRIVDWRLAFEHAHTRQRIIRSVAAREQQRINFVFDIAELSPKRSPHHPRYLTKADMISALRSRGVRGRLTSMRKGELHKLLEDSTPPGHTTASTATNRIPRSAVAIVSFFRLLLQSLGSQPCPLAAPYFRGLVRPGEKAEH